jgi:hypothetical protein
LGFLLSAFLIFSVAVIEINFLAVILNINPTSLGLETNIDNIASKLASTDQTPNIIAAENDKRKIPIAIAIANAGSDNFFGKNILTSVPSALVIPIAKKLPDTLYIGDFLIFANINYQDLELLSPRLGYLLVKSYFPERNIKFYPKTRIMQETEYLAHRKFDSLKKAENINKAILSVDDKISSFSSVIENNDVAIKSSLEFINAASEQKDVDYRRCLAAKTPKKTCQDKRGKLESEMELVRQDVNLLQVENEYGKKQLAIQNSYKDFFEQQKEMLLISQESIPFEVGMFDPKDSIRIVFGVKNLRTVEDYLQTLTHEYLHYASYISDTDRLESSFFEEALTEYFARSALARARIGGGNLAYPIQLKIIAEIASKFAESDLVDVYFTKDNTQLEVILNRVFGDNFYENNYLLFETLQFASDQKQILKIGNDIMSVIGGPALTEEDLKSAATGNQKSILL